MLLGLAVVGRERCDLAVIAARSIGIAQPAARDPRELAQELEPDRLGDRRTDQLVLERRGDLAPLVGLAGEPQ
ncbi:MAG: hypothetical protein E6J91_51185, partial [Deltaproteobacteria bacterium]